jgi:transcriptional regulator with XRE-family HTH domain
LVGVTRAAVCLWESGKRWPSSEDLPRIAKTLGCSIDDLFREETAAQDEINMEGTA